MRDHEVLDEVIVRDALPTDVRAICDFGALYISGHYRPLIGGDVARGQVEQWWNLERISDVVGSG